MLPDGDNRVRLRSGAQPDDPVPAIEIRFRVDDYTRAGWRHAERTMAHVFDRIGVVEGPSFQDDPEEYTGAGHIMGTVRMGTDPSRSVTDSTGKVHGTDGLYAAGSGLFPTGGTANPTLTVAALALRQAVHVDRALDRAG
jgi:choline dehydrogenase-like flavoprotein